jgi:hypothetical protein
MPVFPAGMLGTDRDVQGEPIVGGFDAWIMLRCSRGTGREACAARLGMACTEARYSSMQAIRERFVQNKDVLR